MITAAEILKQVLEGERITTKLQDDPIKNNDLGIFIEGLIEAQISAAVAPAISNMLLQRELGALTFNDDVAFTIRSGMTEDTNLQSFESYLRRTYPVIYSNEIRREVASAKAWEQVFGLKAPNHVVTISDRVFYEHGFEIFYFLIEKQLLKLAALKAYPTLSNRDCAFGVAAAVRRNLIGKVMTYLASQRTYNVHAYNYRTKSASGKPVIIVPKYFPSDTEIALTRLYGDHKDYHQEPFEFFRNTDATSLLNE